MSGRGGGGRRCGDGRGGGRRGDGLAVRKDAWALGMRALVFLRCVAELYHTDDYLSCLNE